MTAALHVRLSTRRPMSSDLDFRYENLRRARWFFRWLGPVLLWTFLLFGGAGFYWESNQLLTLTLSTSERVWAAVKALFYLGGATLLGFVLDRLLRAAGDVIDLLIAGETALQRTANSLERQLVPALQRLAQSLEARPANNPHAAPPAPTPTAHSPEQLALDSIRARIHSEHWEQARRLILNFVEHFPDSPHVATLSDDFESARRQKAESLRQTLLDAQKAGDATQVLQARDRLTQYLSGDPLTKLDEQVVTWLVGHIRARLVGGRAKEVVRLAEQVAETFADVPAAAPLRQSLPTLRRSAGLCPSCGNPYDVELPECPSCQAKRRPSRIQTETKA